ncbi:MAG: phenylalanine--tRNA ligase subunit beta, partial [Spirochaetaceae bacterium]|nr:phenylalanine--tRNA ligase subunit beta [Spirochaetaceae bacterium]
IPPYRNDFLHPADVAEDVMIGRGLSSFSKEKPRDFTIGRLLPITELSRKTKMLLVGQGYQEMIFNYLGSKLNFIDKMNFDGSAVIEISNPMTENYQFVRPSVLPSLLGAESTSANAVYPHKIFEIGKVAYICDEENTGCRTRQVLGMLSASAEDNFNTMASEVASLLFYLGFEYAVEASSDSRFIPGRQVKVLAKKDDKQVVAGIFGEIHPAVLENWQITMPCVAAELDLEELISAM